MNLLWWHMISVPHSFPLWACESTGCFETKTPNQTGCHNHNFCKHQETCSKMFLLQWRCFDLMQRLFLLYHPLPVWLGICCKGMTWKWAFHCQVSVHTLFTKLLCFFGTIKAAWFGRAGVFKMMDLHSDAEELFIWAQCPDQLHLRRTSSEFVDSVQQNLMWNLKQLPTNNNILTNWRWEKCDAWRSCSDGHQTNEISEHTVIRTETGGFVRPSHRSQPKSVTTYNSLFVWQTRKPLSAIKCK